MTPEVTEFLSTFMFYQEHGTLPEAGGLLDQAATWVDASAIMLRRLSANHAEDRETDRKKRDRERQRDLAARQGRH